MSLTDLSTAAPATAAGPKAYSVGMVDDVPMGEGRTFVVAGSQVAVFRLRDGSLHATQAACPHAGGPIADAQSAISTWWSARCTSTPTGGPTASRRTAAARSGRIRCGRGTATSSSRSSARQPSASTDQVVTRLAKPV